MRIKEEYDQLLTSGMFWEFFPEFTGEWSKDELAFTEFYNKRENDKLHRQ